jgi:tRNA modification GTPase
VFSTSDTIVAIATPPGRGGIGVVRLSGPDAPRIAQTLVARPDPFAPRHATLCAIVEPAPPAPADSVTKEAATATVDQVVVTWFAAPHSYTGDDVVEVSGHGSPLLLRRIVELAMHAGARLAEPGEFTFRAFLNGRLDLVQAEAVADLVDAVTPLQARAAMDQLEGTLTTAIGRIDAALFDLSARLEASLDFPDEGFHFATRDETRRDLDGIRASLARLSADGRRGRVIREGRSVVIVGPPNAGKSSLFNALVGSARAIVTDVPGTTRDVLTERVDIGGVPVTLVDTAGMRDAGDAIEAEGVARARQARTVAAVTVVVLDRSVPLSAADLQIVAETTGQKVIVRNKADLAAAWTKDDAPRGLGDAVDVSAIAGDGLSVLRDRLAAELTGVEDLRDAPFISNVRHLALVDEALDAVGRADAAIERGATEELVLVDLAAARQALEAITGRRTPEDLLHHIFARFCVGK